MSKWRDLAKATEKMFSSKISETDALALSQLKELIGEVREQHKKDIGLEGEITIEIERQLSNSEEEFSPEAEKKFRDLLEAMKELGIK